MVSLLINMLNKIVTMMKTYKSNKKIRPYVLTFN